MHTFLLSILVILVLAANFCLCKGGFEVSRRGKKASRTAFRLLIGGLWLMVPVNFFFLMFPILLSSNKDMFMTLALLVALASVYCALIVHKLYKEAYPDR